MGAIVSAAGTIAGGLAGQAVQNALTPESKPGGGIPGVTTSQGGGKDGDTSKNFPQVDPTIAIDYFKQAADTQKAGYTQGLEYYAEQMKRAVNYVTVGYNQANQTLKPLSYAAGQALNEQMRMMGMDPLPATGGLSETLRSTYNDFVKEQFPDASGFINNLANQLDAADKIKDPVARAEAKMRVQEKFSSFDMNFVQPIQDQINNLKVPVKPNLNGLFNVDLNGSLDEVEPYRDLLTNPQASKSDPTFLATKAAIDYKDERTAYRQQLAALQGKLGDASTYSSGIKELGDTWSQNYANEYDAGYTGDQIMDKIKSTPGYDFQMKAGTQALTRQGAASGMLNSGNTGIALQEYGQGQASSYYNQYMTNLQAISAQGSPATMQISANQSSLGNALGTIAQTYGAAKMDTARSIADYSANTLMQSGNLFNQTAMFNAGLQFQGQQNALNRQAGSANAATSAAPGLAGVANNAYQYNNNFAQGLIQQASANAGFLRGMN